MTRRRAFTLVEMMIVVLVIGILITIAFPNWVTARERSQRNSCVSNLKQIDSGKEQHAMLASLGQGAAVNWVDIVPSQIKAQPLCPTGGTYTVDVIGSNPSCTVGVPRGHVLP